MSIQSYGIIEPDALGVDRRALDHAQVKANNTFALHPNEKTSLVRHPMGNLPEKILGEALELERRPFMHLAIERGDLARTIGDVGDDLHVNIILGGFSQLTTNLRTLVPWQAPLAVFLEIAKFEPDRNIRETGDAGKTGIQKRPEGGSVARGKFLKGDQIGPNTARAGQDGSSECASGLGLGRRSGGCQVSLSRCAPDHQGAYPH